MINVSASLFQRQQSNTLYENFFQSKVAGADQGNQDQLAHFTLNNALKESVGVEIKRPVSPTAELFDVDAVVNTVMDHIESRIGQAADEGASDDELANMVAAAREGVERGFGQARDQLNEIGKLDDALGSKINEAESGIAQGIDDLEQGLFAAEESDIGRSFPTSVYEREISSYSRKDSFSFELMTQEGDRIQISAFNAYAERSENVYAADENSAVSANAFAAFESAGYSLAIQGDLNEEEMSALQDLFAQVDDVAENFYSGDVETAFNMALELGYDDDQIAGFSLNLRQVETATYQYAGYQGFAAEPNLPRGIGQPLADYAQGLAEAVDKASLFQNPMDLVKTMLEELDSNTKAQTFAQPIFDALGQGTTV